MTCSNHSTRTARPAPRLRSGRGGAGQSLIESCLAIALICLVFLGLFQVSRLLAAREVLFHAAARAARARTVGLNQWMVHKSAMVAAIPNAGRLTEPPFDNADAYLRGQVAGSRPGSLWSAILHYGEPPSRQFFELEQFRIPEFMASEDAWQARYILDYEGWDSVHAPYDLYGNAYPGNPPIEMRVTQTYPLWVPMHRLYYGADDVRIEGRSALENHYPLYLDEHNW